MSRAQAAERRAGEKLAESIMRLKKRADRPAYGPPLLEEDPDSDDPTTVWILTDGRLCWRTPDGVRRTSGTLGGSGTSTAVPLDDPEVTEQTTTYAPVWSRGFCLAHGPEDGSRLRYGDHDGHPNCRLMFGFAVNLPGADIRQVELRALNVDADSDVELSWGLHATPTLPSTYDVTEQEVLIDVWPASGYGGDDDGWHTMPDYVGEQLRDGTAYGLVLDQPDGLLSAGVLDATSVRLSITYTVEA